MAEPKLVEQDGDWEMVVDFAGDERRGITYVGHATLKNKKTFKTEKFASTQVFATKAAATSAALKDFAQVKAKHKG